MVTELADKAGMGDEVLPDNEPERVHVLCVTYLTVIDCHSCAAYCQACPTQQRFVSWSIS